MLSLCALSLPGWAQDTVLVRSQDLENVLNELQREKKVVYVKSKPAAGPALRTNVLWWGVGAPNLGFELPLSERWSLGVDGGFMSWDRFFWNDGVTAPRRWRHFAVVPDARWYSRAVGNGFFLDINLLYAHYNVGNVKMPFGLYKSLRTDYRQGNLFGGGLSAGYAWPLGARWRIEAEAGLIVGGYRHDTYYIDSHCRHCIIDTDLRGVGLVPRIGVGVVYTFGSREKGEEE